MTLELTGVIGWAAAGLVVARWVASLWLSHLNRGSVLAHANEIPEAFVGIVDEPTYARSVAYTLAKSRFGQFVGSYGAIALLAVLFSGVLPWAYELTIREVGSTAWAMALFLFSVALAIGLSSLPLAWIAQFRLEERFGFNTGTQKTWWLDLVKRLFLAIGFGYPLLVLILRIVEWAGPWWWVWAWGTMMGIQLLVMVLAPLLILPLFNKLSPLPEGSLKDCLKAMAKRARFVAQSIQVMDGSRRSSHSNAFFTGIGRFRKIVLFDTLITQMEETEMEAVLAHEIGHYRRKHLPKMILGSAVGGLAGLWTIAWLAMQPVFVEAFGFSSPTVTADFTGPAVAPVLVVFALLSGALTFWLDPIIHWVSRRFEYQADAFASEVMGGPGPMIDALRKLNEKNLNNLTPHPLYSGFYNSHPTLLEREAALRES
jgi:STE24 endopeptidase